MIDENFWNMESLSLNFWPENLNFLWTGPVKSKILEASTTKIYVRAIFMYMYLNMFFYSSHTTQLRWKLL